MTDPIVDFFEGLNRRRPPPPLPGRIRGRLRLDLRRGDRTDHWLVTITEYARATTDHGPADCVITAEAPFFERLIKGQESAIAAALRNKLAVEGDLSLFIQFNRLLPGPPDAHDPRTWARDRRHDR